MNINGDTAFSGEIKSALLSQQMLVWNMYLMNQWAQKLIFHINENTEYMLITYNSILYFCQHFPAMFIVHSWIYHIHDLVWT